MGAQYDVVIIGSGLGGLVCGYILSKNGYKVIIVEKNHQIGGCLQTFQRKGVKFDTGMHYIGSMQPGQILHSFFSYLNLNKDVTLSPLDPNGFETISLQGRKYYYANGYENFIETLAKSFPKNREEIKEYVKQIRAIADASPINNLQEINNHIIIEPNIIKATVNEFIESITSNKELQNVLIGNLPLYAGVKDKTPIYIHAFIKNFYIQSAYRIVGGSDVIASSLANSIRSFGGEIITSQEVDKIICDSTHATAIQTKEGELITGKFFISNVHPEITMEKIESPLIRKIYKERIKHLENSIGNFTVYIKFKPDSVPYLNSNFYFYEFDDLWETNNYNPEKWPQSYLFMHQCNQKEMTFAESAELSGYMKFDDVREWENTTVGKRGEAYLQFKEEKAERFIKKLNDSFPGIMNNIEYYETSTPLTYRDYTATKEGSMYGILRDANLPVQTYISQRTKIPNLFLTGQNINTHGILGVMIGSIITCAEFIGLNNIIKDIHIH